MTADIGTISYATAAVAFLFLSLLLLTSWRGRLQGAMLTAACLISALWAAVVAYQVSQGHGHSLPGDVLEILRDAGWLAFLAILLGVSRQAAAMSSRGLGLKAAGVMLLCILLIAAAVYPHVFSVAVNQASNFLTGIAARVVLAVIGMVLVEQLFRNTRSDQRWGIKYLCLGVGGMFAYDFYLYSDAMLFKRIDGAIWEARGIINALIVPLIAVSAARNPKWSLEIFVSRRILFHSAALFGAGVYLLVMAAVGYYLRFFGGNWGTVLQVTFLFGAALLLIMLLFSGTLRARLRVFLSKHFFSYKYDYREEWLRFTRTLSEGEPGVRFYERSIQAIAELVESPGGALWLIQESGAFERAAHWNMPAANGIEQAGGPLCRFLEGRQWVVNLEEYAAQPDLYAALELPGWLRSIPKAWLVVPLVLHDRLIGFVVLARSRGQVHFNWEVSDLLKTAGRQAASYLAQVEAAKGLLVARQFESFNRMSAFVVHDLKNLVSQLSLLLANAERHQDNPAFRQDMLGTIGHSVEKMKGLLLQLRAGGQSNEKPVPLPLDELVRRVITAQTGAKHTPALEITSTGLYVLAHRERLERVIGHLIQNAIEATPAEGRVRVRLNAEDNCAIIEISDTGCGMSEQFIRDNLFKPFVSTKATGMGIGTYESREYIHQLGGRIEVTSCEAIGTLFRVIVRLYSAQSIAGYVSKEAL